MEERELVFWAGILIWTNLRGEEVLSLPCSKNEYGETTRKIWIIFNRL